MRRLSTFSERGPIYWPGAKLALAILVIAQLWLGARLQAGLGDAPTYGLTTQRLGNMPLAFTQNNGQWDKRVLFRADAGLATVWITTEGTYYQFTRRIPKEAEMSVPADPFLPRKFSHDSDSLEQMIVKASFVGANPITEAAGDQAMEYKCNYFLGNDPAKWRTDVPNYRVAVLKEVYPGVDLRYYGNGDGKLEYDFVVSPGADPSQIAVRYEGAKSVSVNASGELVVETNWNTVVEQHPVVYQIDGGTRREIICVYSMRGDNTFGFTFEDDYDPALALVIDPALVYSTYLGGSSGDLLMWDGIAVGRSGCAYVTGSTGSLDFPTQNAFDPSYNGGGSDAFVTKFSSSGNSLIYSTYLGGSFYDYGTGIAVDSFECAYVMGTTHSGDFPTQNAYQPSNNGTCYNAFVTKLSSSGNSLLYSTFLGGSGCDYSGGIAIDGSGCAYVTGLANSSDFPTLNAYDASFNGGWDCFVTKLSPSGSALIYSTYLGGSGADEAMSIAVDDSGAAYVTGYTSATDYPPTQSDFPTKNGYDMHYNGGNIDAFVTKFSSSGNELVYSTFLGGLNNERGYGIAVDHSGCAFVTGYTWSPDFPTQNAYDASSNGSSDAFVTKLSSSGNSLIYSTFLGGSGDEGELSDIDIDGSGCGYVAGSTSSSDLPRRNG